MFRIIKIGWLKWMNAYVIDVLVATSLLKDVGVVRE